MGDLAIDLFTQPLEVCLHYLEPRRLGPPPTGLRLTAVHKEGKQFMFFSLFLSRSSCFHSSECKFSGSGSADDNKQARA